MTPDAEKSGEDPSPGGAIAEKNAIGEPTGDGVRAYFVTVGLSQPGPHDIVEALANDVRQMLPKFLGIVCTGAARSTAERLIEKLGSDLPGHEIRELPEAYDLNEAFAEMNSFVRAALEKHALQPHEIAINYTSGTKVMAAGALLSGVFHEVDALRYLAWREGAPGSAPIVTNPRAIHAHRDTLLALRLARELRFMSACDVLRGIDQEPGSGDGRPLGKAVEAPPYRQRLRRLFEAFGSWDAFQYESAIVAFRRALDIQATLAEPFEPGSEILDHLSAITEAVDSSRFDRRLMADLYNNALRRLHEEKANDAAQRAYRCLEMLAQWKLHDAHGIDTHNVDVRKIPPLNREQYSAQRSLEDGRIRIGLRRSYELLAILRDPLGTIYSESKELREILAGRYKSLLAHGNRPLTMAEARALVRKALEIVGSEFPDFAGTCRALQFPWIAGE